ncbi:hypothetical protein GGF31_005983 [Allomyces arbusculus]|nr:hypothetical protein GGF31_005983 [Allomyces arbusculus]
MPLSLPRPTLGRRRSSRRRSPSPAATRSPGDQTPPPFPFDHATAPWTSTPPPTPPPPVSPLPVTRTHGQFIRASSSNSAWRAASVLPPPASVFRTRPPGMATQAAVLARRKRKLKRAWTPRWVVVDHVHSVLHVYKAPGALLPADSIPLAAATVALRWDPSGDDRVTVEYLSTQYAFRADRDAVVRDDDGRVVGMRALHAALTRKSGTHAHNAASLGSLRRASSVPALPATPPSPPAPPRSATPLSVASAPSRPGTPTAPSRRPPLTIRPVSLPPPPVAAPWDVPSLPPVPHTAASSSSSLSSPWSVPTPTSPDMTSAVADLLFLDVYFQAQARAKGDAGGMLVSPMSPRPANPFEDCDTSRTQ